MPRARGRVRRVAPRHGRVRGRRARSTLLQWLLTNDLDASSPGARSTRTCSIPTTRTSSTTSSCGGSTPERFFVMPNASNTDRLARRVRRGRGARRRRGRRSPTSPRRARCSRCRGPRRARCSRPSAPTRPAVPRFAVRAGRASSDRSPAPATPARTASRSTCPPADAPGAVGRARRRRASRPPGSARATRCGSKPGCRCTATSSGPGITPLQAGLGWVVALGQGRLPRPRRARGRAGAGRRPPAARARDRGPAPAARGLRRCCVDGAEVGAVTSGNFSPTLGHAIALAFLPPDIEPGARRRGRRARQAARRPTVVKPPFVEARDQ